MRIYIERREFKMSERESFLLVFLLAGFCGLKNYKAKKKKKNYKAWSLFPPGTKMAQAITQGAGQGEPTCQPGWNKRDKLLASPAVAPWGFGDRVN